jgi:sec-independent protein translocase protein TatC
MPPSGPDSPADPPPPPSRHEDDDEFNEFPGLLEGDPEMESREAAPDDAKPDTRSADAAEPLADSTEQQNAAPGEMGFLDHLEEFRVTAVKCVIALLAGMGIVGALFPWFFDILLHPLTEAVHLAHLDPKDTQASEMLYSTSIMGVFTVILEVTLFGGIALSLPAIGYFVIRFVAPGLTEREKSLLRPALMSALFLFFLGAFFSYFFLLPASLAVSLKLNAALHLNPMWNAPDYYELVTWLTLGTGLIFEFPLILVILQVLGVVSTGQLRGYRRHAIVVILVIAAVIAPPEVVAMFLMAAPMYLLFELSLIVGERLRRRHLAAAAAAPHEE